MGAELQTLLITARPKAHRTCINTPKGAVFFFFCAGLHCMGIIRIVGFTRLYTGFRVWWPIFLDFCKRISLAGIECLRLSENTALENQPLNLGEHVLESARATLAPESGKPEPCKPETLHYYIPSDRPSRPEPSSQTLFYASQMSKLALSEGRRRRRV